MYIKRSTSSIQIQGALRALTLLYKSYVQKPSMRHVLDACFFSCDLFFHIYSVNGCLELVAIGSLNQISHYPNFSVRRRESPLSFISQFLQVFIKKGTSISFNRFYQLLKHSRFVHLLLSHIYFAAHLTNQFHNKWGHLRASTSIQLHFHFLLSLQWR